MEFEDYDEKMEEMIQLCNENGMIPEWAVLFVTDDEIVHSVFYEQYPNVADISHNIEEMKTDSYFGIGEDETNECCIAIIPIEDGGDIEKVSTEKVSIDKYFKCNDCGIISKEVKKTVCPYDAEIYGKETLCYLCPSCKNLRAEEI